MNFLLYMNSLIFSVLTLTCVPIFFGHGEFLYSGLSFIIFNILMYSTIYFLERS